MTYDCNAKGGLKDPNTGDVMQGLNWFTVCNYGPRKLPYPSLEISMMTCSLVHVTAGNYLGEFDKNVGKSLGMKPYRGP